MGKMPRGLAGAKDLESFQGRMTRVSGPGDERGETYSESALLLLLLGDLDHPS